MSVPRVIAGYLSMVLVPSAILVSVLALGRSLKAPFNVDGVWNLEMESVPAVNTACRANFSSGVRPAMTISQSGRYLHLTLNDTRKTAVDGEINGLSLSGGKSSGQCSDLPLALTGTLDAANHASLSGSFAYPGCNSCPPAPFRAVRMGN